MLQVDLFPTQTETDCLFVIVLASTRVRYSNQCGGTACEEQQAEGFLVPIGAPEHLAAIKAWFRRRFGESCWCDGRLAASPAVVQELAGLIATLPCWAQDSPTPLSLDLERLPDGCEAWVPVQSPFGPGWLTWTNSD